MSQELILSSIILAILAIGTPLLFTLTKKLGPNFRENADKNLPYESGITNPVGVSSTPIDVKFYIVAIIFVLFDVEIIFMFPWAVNLKSLGILGIVEMFSFMGLLIAGLIYIYWKKALTWQ